MDCLKKLEFENSDQQLLIDEFKYIGLVKEEK
jgi:hypothetical protein